MFALIPRYRLRRIFNAIKWKIQNFVFLACFIAAMWWYTGISAARLGDMSFMQDQAILGGGDIFQLINPPYRMLTAALLHGGTGHLMGNTMGFIIFASASIIFAERDWIFFLIFFGSLIGGSLGCVFLMGPNTTAIGASGVTYGFIGFVFAIGFFRRSFLHLALSGLALFYFGNTLVGATPLVARGISWHAHLGGLIGGAGAAFYSAQVCNEQDVQDLIERKVTRESRRRKKRPTRKKRRRRN